VKTFYISDTHFGHKNIIRLANRPFTDVSEMDQCMIDRWNAVVGLGDVVYHLGDFSWHDPATNRILFSALNGRKVLIRGNHDASAVQLPWEDITFYQKLGFVGGGVVLFHYPITEWDGFHRGVVHFHGHVHGASIFRPKNSYDVGVEKLDYTPRTFDEIVAGR
jgi:calcineurin-like phosphoesterase family protein